MRFPVCDEVNFLKFKHAFIMTISEKLSKLVQKLLVVTRFVSKYNY